MLHLLLSYAIFLASRKFFNEYVLNFKPRFLQNTIILFIFLLSRTSYWVFMRPYYVNKLNSTIIIIFFNNKDI